MLSAGCGCLLAALVPVTAVAPALASAPRLVRVGAAPQAPVGSRALGTLAPGTRVHITVALEPRDPTALSSYATAVSTPGSSAYHRYLTPGEFARRFGASSAAIGAVRDSLLTHGLTPGAASANGLSIPVTGTASSLEQGLSTTLERLVLPGRRTAIVNRVAPALDAAVAPLVQDVIGLDTLGSPQPLLVRHGALARPSLAHAGAHVATGGPQPCSAASAAAPGQSSYTADQIASAYGFSGLYGAGDEGQGQTIALYELEPDDPADIAAFQQCYGTHTSVSYVPVDGGAGSGAGSGEAALDIEAVIGLAPKASILVYQAPNSASNGPGAGPYDDFSAIISQDRAQVISSSWGGCESVEGAADAHAEETLFEEAAAQGQTIVSASGDDGSEDCFGPPATGDSLATELAVDDPSSDPFVTGVGGTSLTALGPRPTETTWNNGDNFVAATLEISPGAGGGGISSLWPMPAYQSNAPAALRLPEGSGDCGASRCREVPDVSADADPTTGYMIYWNGSDSMSGEPAGWQGIGGTSLAAPIWAAVLALANASQFCDGTALGFVNPGLYAAAANAYPADFNDITTGNNDFTGTNDNQYPAGPGYDLATGLGSPNASSLAPTLCAQTLRIPNPGPQSSTVHTRVALHLKSLGVAGASPRYTAHGLPAGLSINHSTGEISGKPRSIGTSSVVVAASGRYGAVTSMAFQWTIGAAPTLSRASLTGVGQRRPQLRFTLDRGRGAPDLKAVAIALPRGLRFASKVRDVTLTEAGGARLRFTATVARGVLTLTAIAPASRLTATVRYAALTTSPGLAAAVADGRTGRLTVTATATDALGHATRLRASVKPSAAG
jgi:subtilase family serine protease